MLENFDWNPVKSRRLKVTRGVSFEELAEEGRIVDIIDHPTRTSQEILLIRYKDYIWAVPCVQREGCCFLKTLYPSRKYTKLLRGEI